MIQIFLDALASQEVALSLTHSLTQSQCHVMKDRYLVSLTLALADNRADIRQEADSRQETADRMTADRRQKIADSRQ